MQEVFLKLLGLSLTGSLFALAVMLLRLVFRKAPRWIFCALWGVVALRLILPFSIESRFSMIPEPIADGNIIASIGDQYVGNVDTYYESNAGFNHAVDAGRQPIYSDDGYYVVTEQGSLEEPATIEDTVFPILSWVWITGMASMLTYLAISFLLLRRKMAEATLLRDNIWQCEQVDSPFALGFIKPRIYLPYAISESDIANVIAHEKAHLSRKDHWWKPIGFLLLAMHWFNPILWVAYILLCRDIEAACDEKVIKHMEKDEMRSYSTALLNCSVHRRRIAACPLAFGEVGVKERIKHVMNYKKPAFWIIIAAMVICIIMAVCFLTNPTDSYGIGIQSIRGTTYTENNNTPAIELDYFLLRDGEDHLRWGQWIHGVSQEEAERTTDGTIPYDGSLGKYRIMIEFQKTGPSASFRKSHEEGTVYTLEGMPGRFKDSVYYKVVYPEDGGMIIYVGSDIPFSFKEPGMYNTRYLSGPLKIRLVPFAEPEPHPDIVETFASGYKTYYRLSDGRWKADGRIYQYRHELVGKMPNSTMDSTFVYLSNLETISFEQAWQKSGFINDMQDCFTPEEAVLVDWIWWPGSFEDENPDTDIGDENDEYSLVDPPVTPLDCMISDTILKLYLYAENDALIDTESHIILAQETINGNPVIGETEYQREETVFVIYVKQHFRVVNGYYEECAKTSGKALITFGVNEYGMYDLKDFQEIQSFADLGKELGQKFISATEVLSEKEAEYYQILGIKCWGTVGSYLEQLKAQGTTAPGMIGSSFIANWACDSNGDGKKDFCYGTGAGMLRPWE